MEIAKKDQRAKESGGRKKARRLIFLALRRAYDECTRKRKKKKTVSSTTSMDDRLRSLGKRIETGFFEEFGDVNDAYRSHLRSLCMNLKRKRNDFAKRLLRGRIKAKDVSRFSKDDMAGTSAVENKRRILDAHLRTNTIDDGGVASTDFLCPQCGNDDTRVVMPNPQSVGGAKCETWGRKDGMPSVAWITCQDCGNKWSEDFG